MTTTPTTPLDVDRVLNEGRWTDYQKWLVFLTALTIVFDGFDNKLLGVALPTIMREWSVGRAAFAPVVSLGYLGMMIGGTLASAALIGIAQLKDAVGRVHRAKRNGRSFEVVVLPHPSGRSRHPPNLWQFCDSEDLSRCGESR